MMCILRVLSILAFTIILSTAAFAQKNKPLAENFSAATLDGQTVELESLKGKVVVMTFWSTRCAICVAEIPRLNQIAKSYQGKDVVFLGLTTDNPSIVESFLKSKPFDFNIIPSSFSVLLKYAERDREGRLNMGFPAYFVINQTGEIELKASGWSKTETVNSQITKLLENGTRKAE
jgi:peroxiredoxin